MMPARLALAAALLLPSAFTTPLDGDEGIDFDTIFSSLSFAVAAPGP